MKYLLDASALLAYLLAEPEADKVERMIFMDGGGEPVCAVSFAAWVGIFACLKRVGAPMAEIHEQLEDARHLPIATLWPDEETLKTMLEIRAKGFFPFADCLAVATAVRWNLILAHKDEHFDKLDFRFKRLRL